MGDAPENGAGLEIQVPPRPDVRASLCHTLLASGFILLGVQNPFAEGGSGPAFHSWMMGALAVVVAHSWWMVARRLLSWRALPEEIRARASRGPADVRQRALNHLTMALLALLLTAFSFLGRIAAPEVRYDEVADTALLSVGIVTAACAVAAIASAFRDLTHQRGARR